MKTRRTFLKSTAALSALPALSACADLGAPSAGAPFDAVVTKGSGVGGAPTFASVSEALAAAPRDGSRPFRIFIRRGEWRERPIVTAPFVHLVGEDRDKTVIVFNTSAGDPGPDGKAVGTFGTVTLAVRAPDFRASNLTIANDFDYLAHLSPQGGKIGMTGAQAVAFSLEAGADRSYLEKVRFLGHQDTLFADAGRTLFRNCRIEGSVDFIFGAGRAVFDSSEIFSRHRPGQTTQGYICAPDTDIAQPYGFVFRKCRLEKERQIPRASVALGRPWRHSKTFPDGTYGDPSAVAAAAYVDCWMDDHILRDGWTSMGYSNKEGTRVQFQPEDARFAEYASRGPGAGPPTARRRVMTPEVAATFAPEQVLGGWVPDGKV